MQIAINNLTEFGFVRLLDSLPFKVVYLNIEGGPRYKIAPRLKKFKEVKEKEVKQPGDYPLLKIAGVDIEVLDWAFSYYGFLPYASV